MRAKDVPHHEIEKAKSFIRQPLGDIFQVHRPLIDRDFVNMRFEELAHLLAWYATLRIAAHAPPAQPQLNNGIVMPLLPAQSEATDE